MVVGVGWVFCRWRAPGESCRQVGGAPSDRFLLDFGLLIRLPLGDRPVPLGLQLLPPQRQREYKASHYLWQRIERALECAFTCHWKTQSG